MRDYSQLIAEKLVQENAERSKGHTPSGLLSASTIGWPLQWQILKWIGVPMKESDSHDLGVFYRGRMAERAILELLKDENPQTQIAVNYRGVIGYVDMVIGDEVVEIKSMSSKYFKPLECPKQAHAMQASIYALALEKDAFGVLYVDSDTYSTKFYEQQTYLWRMVVDKIIDDFEKAKQRYIDTKEVPAFVPLNRQQTVQRFNPYPQFAGFSDSFVYT